MISHLNEKDITKTNQLATKRELGFYAYNCRMTDGTIKKVSKGLQPFLKREIKGSENMITFVAEVSVHI